MELDAGRTQQKYRTRRALLAAARQLMEQKQSVTIQAAADAAQISRATAYRYFTNAEYLLREALLDGAWETPESVIGDALDVRERVRRVHAYLFDFTRRNEMAHRMFMAKALEASVDERREGPMQLRGARRLPMFELAIEPLRTSFSPQRFHELLLCLAAASGIESYIALKDVCGLDDDAADKIAARNISAILDQALANGN